MITVHPCTERPRTGRRERAAARFAAATVAVTRRLPFGLADVVAPSLLGFLAINVVTFTIDLTLLGLLHGSAHWPLPAALTLAYVTAFGLNFALNRVLNFRSHGDVGRQLGVYVVVVAVNYLLWILGLGDLLAGLGLDYRLARVAAGAAEAAYMYAALRWVVFRRRETAPGSIDG